MKQYEKTLALASVRQTIKDIKQILDDDKYQEDSKFAFLPWQCLRKYKNYSKFVTNSPEIDNNEFFKFSEFTMKDNENSEDSQNKNKSVNSQDSENFEDYSPFDYELSQDSLDIGLIINDQFL